MNVVLVVFEFKGYKYSFGKFYNPFVKGKCATEKKAQIEVIRANVEIVILQPLRSQTCFAII